MKLSTKGTIAVAAGCFIVASLYALMPRDNGTGEWTYRSARDAADQATEARQQEQVTREQREAHERRLAWQKAHPAQYAKQEAEKRAAALRLEQEHIAAARAEAAEQERQAAAALGARQTEEQSDSEYIVRANAFIATTLDHATYSKAVLSTSTSITWYVTDKAAVMGDVDDQVLAFNYRKSFLRMLHKEVPGPRITHERLLDAETGELLPGHSDEDVPDYLSE